MRSLVLFVALISVCVAPAGLSAQSNASPRSDSAAPPAPAQLTYQEADLSHHAIAPRGAVHLTQEQQSAAQRGRLYSLFGSAEFDIIVGEDGHVESATMTRGPEEYADQARQIEMARTFKPWMRDGSTIRVKLADSVPVLPPEKWAAMHVPFPESVDWNTTMVELDRTSCYGSCPAYKVAVYGDGTIHFSGSGGWAGVRIPGDHTAYIAPSAVRDLVLDFKRADFLSAQEKYSASISDGATYILTLRLNGRTKTVVDYIGTQVGLPLAIEDLQGEVDAVPTPSAGSSATAAPWTRSKRSIGHFLLRRRKIWLFTRRPSVRETSP